MVRLRSSEKHGRALAVVPRNLCAWVYCGARVALGIRNSACVALALGITCAGASTAAGGELELVYKVSFAGLPTARLTVSAEITDSTYRIVSQAKSRGPLRLLMRFTSSSESSGTIESGALKPVLYRSESKFGKHLRSVLLEYSPDGTVAAAVVPRAEDEDREAVPAEDTRGTLDPTSATFLAAAGAGNAVPCSQTMSVFDGRRRHDMVFGVTEIDRPPGNEFEGLALRCDYDEVQISGDFRPAEGVPTLGWDEEEDTRSSRIWFVRIVDSEMLIPVRIESGSGLRSFKIVLESVAGGDLAALTAR